MVDAKLAQVGLGSVHGLASPLGAFYPVPHGVVCGTLMAPANRATLNHLTRSTPDHPALSKFAALGRLCSDKAGRSDEWYRHQFIGELEQLADDLNIPPLSKYRISKADIERIVEETGNKYSPARLSREELAAILLARI